MGEQTGAGAGAQLYRLFLIVFRGAQTGGGHSIRTETTLQLLGANESCEHFTTAISVA